MTGRLELVRQKNRFTKGMGDNPHTQCDYYKYIDGEGSFKVHIGIEVTEYELDTYTSDEYGMENSLEEQMYLRSVRNRYTSRYVENTGPEEITVNIYAIHPEMQYLHFRAATDAVKIGEYRLNLESYYESTEHLILSSLDYLYLNEPIWFDSSVKETGIYGASGTVKDIIKKLNYTEFRNTIREKVFSMTRWSDKEKEHKKFFMVQKISSPTGYVRSHLFTIGSNDLCFQKHMGYEAKYIDRSYTIDFGITNFYIKGFTLGDEEHLDAIERIYDTTSFGKHNYLDLKDEIDEGIDGHPYNYNKKNLFDNVHVILSYGEDAINFVVIIDPSEYELNATYLKAYVIVNGESQYIHTVDAYRSHLAQLTNYLVAYNNDSRKDRIHYTEIATIDKTYEF